MSESRLTSVMSIFTANMGQVEPSALAEQTNVPLRTINHLAQNKNTRTDYITMDRLCTFFNVQPGELMAYTRTSGLLTAQERHAFSRRCHITSYFSTVDVDGIS